MLGYNNPHHVYNFLKGSKYLRNFCVPHHVVLVPPVVIETLHFHLPDLFNWAANIITVIGIASQ
jgi:hypothetical protein